MWKYEKGRECSKTRKVAEFRNICFSFGRTHFDEFDKKDSIYSTLHALHNLNIEIVVSLNNNQRNPSDVPPIVYGLPKMRLASADLAPSPLTATAPLMGLPAPSHKTAYIHLSA